MTAEKKARGIDYRFENGYGFFEPERYNEFMLRQAECLTNERQTARSIIKWVREEKCGMHPTEWEEEFGEWDESNFKDLYRELCERHRLNPDDSEESQQKMIDDDIDYEPED